MAMPVGTISFKLNGQDVTLNNLDPNLTLSEWLRGQGGYKGTKRMCGEGGCGCCVLTVSCVDPFSKKKLISAINSCMCPLYSVNGWEVTTIEGIGSTYTGYNPIQQKLAQFNGTQCGYCSPGFVMNMYSLLQDNPAPSEQEIENVFDGNICRCTGYRSILDAMKTFSKDRFEIINQCDIEDLGVPKKEQCKGKCGHACSFKNLPSTSNTQWYNPTTLQEVLEIFEQTKGKSVKLIAGDTGRGIYKFEAIPDVIVNLKTIPDLWKREVIGNSVFVGSCVTLSQLITFLQENSTKSTSFEHLADHLAKIANVPVRNVGTWAGNLMLTHNHDYFPSDVYTIMEAVGALVTITTSEGPKTYSLSQFLSVSMEASIIVGLSIPFSQSNEQIMTFKVMPRAQNAHAYVNAAFRMRVDPSTLTVTGVPSFVFGGITTHGVHAKLTESFMVGLSMTDKTTLQNALSVLDKDLVPSSSPTEASANYRKSLAMALFYKFYLSCIPNEIDPRVASAGIPYVRPISSGQQSYGTDPSEYPVTEPMPKLTALQQTSGEAQYTTDIPGPADELHAAFVVSTRGNAKIVSVDPSQALAMAGVVAYVSAKDIPEGGQNTFLPTPVFEAEPVFATDVSEYAGQSIGMIVAESQELADRAARVVKVTYEPIGTPILTQKEAIKAGLFFPDPAELKVGDADGAISKSKHKVSGEVSCGTQYHFTMETQTSLVVPEDDGYSVYASSQWLQMSQSAVATILGLQNNSVNAEVKRVGGAYGSKITRCHQITAACALGAHVTRRAVRMHMDLDTNMRMIGKRMPYYVNYEVGFDDDGKINGIKMTVYVDSGYSPNDAELEGGFFYGFIDNAYNIPNWLIVGKMCKTNLPCSTACRAPASLPAVFIIESVMDHVARSLTLDNPFQLVRYENMYVKDDVTPQGVPLPYCIIKDIWESLLTSAEVKEREAAVAEYNAANRWRKRGLSVVPLKFPIGWSNAPYTVMVDIYSLDGSVAITHGGVEVGQGINTKVAQAAARILGIPLNIIKIKPTNVLSSPNSETTGGSMTSELNVMAVINACNELNDRIDPVRRSMSGEPTWKEVIAKCFEERVDLSAKAFVNVKTPELYQYFCYGSSCTEVELDVLTGQMEVLRMDILYDCGQSINPEVDIGQAEGALVMGLGYWLTEDVKYDADTGELLTHNTWEYKPPSSKDIPIDLRVALLKNAPNPVGVLRSKAVGEPPQCLSCGILLALKRAIESARREIGDEAFFLLSAPATTDVRQQMCLVDPQQFYF